MLEVNYLLPIVRGLMWSKGADIAEWQRSVAIAKEAGDSDPSRKVELILSSAFEASNLNMANYVIDYYSRNHEFLYGQTYLLRSIFFFVPRSLWPGKPEPFAVTVGKITHSGVQGLALNSTYVGEAYANFGVFAVFVIAISLGVYSLFVNAIRDDAVQAAMFFIGFAGWRFDFNFLIISLAFFYCLRAGYLLLARFRRSRVRSSSLESLNLLG